MNILLITGAYLPEIRSATSLLYELATGLKNRGHSITVLTTASVCNLPENKKTVRFQPLSDEEGIKVIRVKTLPIRKINKYIRGISEISLPYFYRQAAKKWISEKIDIIFVYSPPLSLGILGWQLKKYFRAKLIVNIQDIFPQNAIDLGIIKDPLTTAFFERMEKKVYQKADFITVHSDGNRKFLLEKKEIDSAKIKVIPNWIDFNLFEKTSDERKFQKKWNLENKFILLFAGILGPSQGIDNIISGAKDLKNEKEIAFLLVGDGAEKPKIIEKAKFLSNIFIKDFVDRKNYPQLVKEADVGLLCLSEKNKTPVVPGKILGYMAAGLPVLAVLNKESDGHKIIQDSKCGISVLPGDKEAFVSAVLKLKNNKNLREEMGQNGLNYLKTHFSKKIAVDQHEKLFYS